MSSTKEQPRWYAVDLIIDENAREPCEYAMMEAGALGTETGAAADQLLRVTAYFDHPPNPARVRAELSEALRVYDLPSSSVLKSDLRDFPDKDWLGEWKKNWRPVETGRFIIAPPWSDSLPSPSERILIRIEPGMAFGTGTHETTLLCLAVIEKYFAGGSFLDVGTGTGILAIAAAKLFSDALVEAIDTDADAVEIARENARLNGVAAQITFHVGTIDDSIASADFVCANLTADVVELLLPRLLSVTCGRLVLSGILDSQVESVIARLHECGGPSPIEVIQDGEWAALII